ncbi:MAG: ROK family protein [Aerococcus sp.]|nr:ROK family protein [Aerococcus sp.]
MTTLLTIDVGGTRIKSAVWDQEKAILRDKESVPTPDHLEDFYQVITALREKHAEVSGVAFSLPGAVDNEKGIIEGVSAVPYIHHFPIKQALHERTQRPVAIANDANCAALGEVFHGAGRGEQQLIFVVIGTGIGGAVVLNGQLIPGVHLLAGEFGMMLDQHNRWSSHDGTLVQAAKTYSEQTQTTIDGKGLLEAAVAGDALAQSLTASVYDTLAHLLINLQFTFDPARIIIGGGASKNPDFIKGIRAAIEKLADQAGRPPILPEIVPAKLGNDANLVGAAMYFSQQEN